MPQGFQPPGRSRPEKGASRATRKPYFVWGSAARAQLPSYRRLAFWAAAPSDAKTVKITAGDNSRRAAREPRAAWKSAGSRWRAEHVWELL
jgi:hypothetical protein